MSALASNQVHRFMDRIIFNKSYWKLHSTIDKPVLFLGRSHRKYFHDGLTTVAIAQRLYPNDEDAEWAAWLHIYLDDVCSNDPEFHKFLKKLAKSLIDLEEDQFDFLGSHSDGKPCAVKNPGARNYVYAKWHPNNL